MNYAAIHRFLLMLLAACGIGTVVWVLFTLGAFLGMQWYVSATAIMLMGVFLIVRL